MPSVFAPGKLSTTSILMLAEHQLLGAHLCSSVQGLHIAAVLLQYLR